MKKLTNSKIYEVESRFWKSVDSKSQSNEPRNFSIHPMNHVSTCFTWFKKPPNYIKLDHSSQNRQTMYKVTAHTLALVWEPIHTKSMKMVNCS
jgi:hypothetical protein